MLSAFLQPQTDEYIHDEVARQMGRPIKVEKIHVSRVRAGDTVFHEDKVRTVCIKDVGYDSFMGHKLFGDSHVLGRKPVHRLVMGTPLR